MLRPGNHSSLTAFLLLGTAALALQTLAAPAASGSTPQRGRSDGTGPRTTRTRPSAAPGATRDGDQRPRSAQSPRAGGNSDDPIFGYPPERQQRVWFSIADDDSSSWISYREAHSSMRFDAARFCVFDKDNDGRMTFEEYSQFIVTEATRGRRVLEPVPQERSTGPRRRSAEQLRAAFDGDLDGSISRFEFDTILREYREEAEQFDSNDVFTRIDLNGDKKLSVDELPPLASFLVQPGLNRPRTALPGANTILDLFGESIDMGDSHPPTVVGPVPVFQRLDLNNDGFVDLEDLERLEGRSFNSVRLGSVLNTLDTDYDGRLSKVEFLASMTPPSGR